MLRLSLIATTLIALTGVFGLTACPGNNAGEGEGEGSPGEGEGSPGEGEGSPGEGEGSPGEGEGSPGEGEGSPGEGEGEGEGATGEGEGEGAGGVEICDNGADDDGDGLFDCIDPDCAGDPACVPGAGGTGDACTAANQCAAAANLPVCLTQSFPNGYCTSSCDPADPTQVCPGNGFCSQFLTLGDPNTQHACLESCTQDSDCNTGYHCGDFGDFFGFSTGEISCIPDETCGNGLVEFPESCDGNNIPFTCADLGFAGGTLTCGAAGSQTQCQVDQSGCTDLCNDGKIGPTEQCDGANLNGATCEQFGLVTAAGHTVSCDPTSCQIDTSACNQPVCGNGVIEGFNEECDTTAFQPGDDCIARGHAGGTLSCFAADSQTGFPCSVDDSTCTDTCGDGAATGNEGCDGTDLRFETCESFGLVTDSTHSLQCFAPGTQNECTLDTSNCIVPQCGDDLAQGFEQCDGTDLKGNDCTFFGFAGGTLACNAAGTVNECTFDTSGCTDVCGDGIKGPTEQCDDNNTTDGDGCSGTCQIEECVNPATLDVGTTSGTTVGGDSFLESFCTQAFGPVPSVAFTFTNNGQNPGTLNVQVTAGATTQVAEIRGSCADENTFDSCSPFGNVPDTASAEVAVGATVTVIVFATDAQSAGAFTLDVSFVEQVCGDGVVQTPEECDPPNGTTCDATCHRIVPAAWTCPAIFFGTNDGCDCGCGFPDPDCADATVASCGFCDDTGSCNADPTGACPGTIDPNDNSICQ